MEITTQKLDKCILIEIKGRLNTTNFSDLETKFNELINAGNHSLLIDCSNLEYVSSSGLRVFLVALKTLKKLNGKFALCSFQESIHEVFEMSGFITIFNVYNSKEEALSAF